MKYWDSKEDERGPRGNSFIQIEGLSKEYSLDSPFLFAVTDTRP
jgi:hypothetical protein